MVSKEERAAKKAKRAQITQLLQSFDIGSYQDLRSLHKEMLKVFYENALETEMDEHLGYEEYEHNGLSEENSRNGHSKKTLKTDDGCIEISVPRDRNSDFDPQILKKRQTFVTPEMETKIISMYAKGMTVNDISSHIEDIYGMPISEGMLSSITNKVLEEAENWRNRPLESIYPVVFMDAVHYHVRSEGVIQKRAVYIALAYKLDGKKDVLGMWVGENESAKFWASVLSSLKQRGVEDILIACTDNLTGFTQAINAIYPDTEIQHCIIHQIRNSTKYVSYKHLKEVMKDLKTIYQAVDEQAATKALEAFSSKWDKDYAYISKSWKANWTELATFFKFPAEIRKIIYTNNAAEGFNRQLRKVSKTRSVFPTDQSLFKLLYLAMKDISKKWTVIHRDWHSIVPQLEIYYGDRVSKHLF